MFKADPTFQLHDAEEKPWPKEMYQAMLLNVIFAFETGQDALISRARLLLGLLVSALREQGIFNINVVLKHQQRHFPGTFKPWVEGLLEQLKRSVLFPSLSTTWDCCCSLLTSHNCLG